MDPTASALLGLQQYPADDPVGGIVPPQPNPAHITPQQWQVMQQVGQPLWDAGSKVMSAIASDPVVRYQTAAHQALGTVVGDKLKDAWSALTYPMHNQMPPSFADSSDPRTQAAIGNAATVAQRLISPAGAFRPRPGVVGSGVGGVGPSEAPDVVGPLMQKAPWSAPSVEPQGILAYHGSPHDFEKFDINKIGTGEGAQVYGHGLYYAGREGVAKSYRDALSAPAKPMTMEYNGADVWSPLNRDLIPDRVRQGINELHSRFSWIKDPEAHVPRLKEDLTRTIANYEKGHISMDKWGYDDAKAALETLNNPNFKVKNEVPSPGKMYEVNLKHDPEHMLDWDKPINEQPEVFKKLQDQGWISPHEVEMRKEWADRTKNSRNRPLDALQDWFNDLGQEKIRALKADDRPGELAAQKKIDVIMGWWDHQIKNPREKIDPSSYPTGEAFYKYMTDQHDTPAGASEALKEMGVPGIKYLDAGSRGGAEGSRNYVSFDADSMAILRKYGIAGLLGGGAAGSAAVKNLRDYAAGLPEEDNARMLQLLQQGGT